MSERTRVLPPVVLLLALVAMGLLHALAPVARPLDGGLRWAGAVPIAAGVGLVLWCAGLFRRAETTIIPFQESSSLLTAGPYAWSRNPIYAGMALTLGGVALALGSVTPWLVVPAFVGWIGHRFIRVEEAMLRERFGAEYQAYCGRVRRWL
jgi:protein-S-isoprenylcysteine O-methyltransferase Ste14